MVKLKFNKDLMWESDYNGYEVGYDDIPVVGIYRLRGTDTYFYINAEDSSVLEYWSIHEEE